MLSLLRQMWPTSAWGSRELVPGTRLGRYRIVRLLAVGGMAEIFLARVEGLRGFEKLVVIKRLLPEYERRRNVVRMFLDEARLMATLNHPNIAQVHDVGVARGSTFFAMEYVHGVDVRAILKAAGGRPVPIEHAVGIIADAAAGLHHAHDKRAADGTPLAIVHRDISPSNVLCSYDGAVKVTDFGVAKWAQQQTETRHGTLKGKVAYMSPEQCRGEALDRRSDVFALGILLYELSTGTRLFQGASDYAILEEIVRGQVPPPSSRVSGYPVPLERIVMRALAPDRNRRTESARDVQLQLEAFAHEARLVTGPVVRSRYLQVLFAARIAKWRAAVEAGRSLGQYLASAPAEEISEAGASGSDTAGTAGTAATPSGRVPVVEVGAAPRSRRLAAIAMGAVLGTAAAAWWALSTADAPAPESARAPAPPSPAMPPPPVASPPPPVAAVHEELAPPPKPTPPARRARPRHAKAAPRPAAAAPSTAPPKPRIWDPDDVRLPR